MSQQPTSINDQSRSGNVAIHSKIEHRLSIVPRMSSSSKRNSPAFWLSEELLRLCIVTRNRCPEVPLALKARFARRGVIVRQVGYSHLARKVARRKSVDSNFDSRSLQIYGELLRQGDSCGFACIVRKLAILRLFRDTRNGADVQDVSSFAIAKVSRCYE